MRRNIVEFQLTPQDVSAIRFGISPSHELCHAIRLLISPTSAPLRPRWLRGAARQLSPRTLDVLGLLVGESGYMADFLTSAPAWEQSPDDEAARLAKTPSDGVRTDLLKRAARSRGARQRALTELAQDPERARDLAVAVYQEAWEALLADRWPQIVSMLRSDISVRFRQLTMHGLGELVESLHDRVSWGHDSVRVLLDAHSEVLDCRGRGLVLAPSVMSRSCMVLTEPPAQPSLYYPALGVSGAWERPAPDRTGALSGLLGAGRARVLLALEQPMSTSAVAAAAGVSVSTASHHVTVLRAAGLVESRRDGAAMLHVTTPLGDSLVGA